MKLVFMGTPDFAVAILDSLLSAGHEIVAVYSQPPRPAGRGHKEQLSPVHAFAAQRGLPVRTPLTLRSPEEQAAFAALKADAAIVAAYGLILPQAALDAPRHGCLNVHASLLPRWRGAAPIQRAILAGDTESGVTIMQMEAGLDTGPILLLRSLPLPPDVTAPWLHDRLAEQGAKMIVEALEKLSDGTLIAQTQPDEGAVYAAKLTRDEARIDWSQSALQIDRQVRALNPWPGLWFEIGGERVKVLRAVVESGRSAPPGTVLDDRLLIACGGGCLRPVKVQRAGKAPMEAAEMLRGNPIAAGTVLG
jgi:methionyl-tRNA formyltransferase